MGVIIFVPSRKRKYRGSASAYSPAEPNQNRKEKASLFLNLTQIPADTVGAGKGKIMKYALEIHPVFENPEKTLWYIVMDESGMWYWSYYDRSRGFWHPDYHIRYWVEMPSKETLAHEGCLS